MVYFWIFLSIYYIIDMYFDELLSMTHESYWICWDHPVLLIPSQPDSFGNDDTAESSDVTLQDYSAPCWLNLWHRRWKRPEALGSRLSFVKSSVNWSLDLKRNIIIIIKIMKFNVVHTQTNNNWNCNMKRDSYWDFYIVVNRIWFIICTKCAFRVLSPPSDP